MQDAMENAGDGPDLGILMAIAYRCMIDELTARLARAGFADIRPPDGYVFRALQGEGRTITELAELLGVSKQAALKIVDSMEERGLATRNPVAGDRRVRLIRLSERGRTAWQTAVRINRGIEAELAVQVGAEQASAMRAALEAFVAAHGGLDEARARRARPVW